MFIFIVKLQLRQEIQRYGTYLYYGYYIANTSVCHAFLLIRSAIHILNRNTCHVNEGSLYFFMFSGSTGFRLDVIPADDNSASSPLLRETTVTNMLK